MPWVRKDDQMPIHRKVAPLSDAAYRLEDEAMCWASRNGTDGRIGHNDLRQISKRGRPKYAAELVAQGLWHEAGDGCPSEKCAEPEENREKTAEKSWVIHDYLEYNPSAAQVKTEREAKAKRQARWRESKAGRRTGDASTPQRVDASRDAAPSRPAPKEAGRGTPRATAAGRPADAGRRGTDEHHAASPPPTDELNRLREQLRTASHNNRTRRARRQNGAMTELRDITDNVFAQMEANGTIEILGVEE